MTVTLHHTDMLEWLAAFDGPLFDSAVTDPPYHLTSIVKRFGGANAAEAKDRDGAFARQARGFMGKQWDGGDIAQRPETWRAVYDALKPGAHLVAFAGTRTYHRMACAIEDAGFEIRDQLGWTFGSGFPKSHSVPVAIDKINGAKPRGKAFNMKGRGDRADELDANGREFLPPYQPTHPEAAAWEGWGTALKPAWEPICLARKPLSEKSVAANVLRWGTGAINIDGCRVGTDEDRRRNAAGGDNGLNGSGTFKIRTRSADDMPETSGRWPANLIHDNSEEVLAGFPDSVSTGGDGYKNSIFCGGKSTGGHGLGDSGSAARFFYSAKAGPLDRIGSAHATIKPVDLMRWLCRLVTPPGGHILEPFAGSGTTGIACMAEGFDATMLELEADHVADIERKLAYLRGEGRLSFVEHDRQRDTPKAADIGGLFGAAA